MKKITLIILAILTIILTSTCLSLNTVNADTLTEIPTVFLREGGNGDGSSPVDPVGTVKDAMEKAASYDITTRIQVIGEVTLDVSATFYSPVHTNKIVFTGKGTDGKLSINTTNGSDGVDAIWFLNGDLQFEDILFEITPYRMYMFTQFYDLYMLDGVEMTKGHTNGANEISIRAAHNRVSESWDGAKYTKSGGTIVLNSGYYLDVAGFCQNSTLGSLDGDVTVVIGGTATLDTLTIARNAYGSVNNATIILNGGKINRFVGYCDRSKSNLTSSGLIGAKENYKMIVTENFDASKSFRSSSTSSLFHLGISGVSIYYDASYFVGNKSIGSYTLEIEEGIYDSILSQKNSQSKNVINTASFDSGAIKKIPSRTGLSTGIVPSKIGAASTYKDNTIYLKYGEMGDGTSANSPLGSLSDAMELAASFDSTAKIQLVGEYPLDFTKGAFHSPEHSNLIVFSGRGTDGKINANTTNGGEAKWFLNGDLQFEDIEFNLSPWRIYFITQLHDLYMTNGIVMSANSNKIGIITALSQTEKFFDGTQFNGDYKIVLLSGVYDAVSLFSQGGAKGDLNGTATLVFGGTAEAWQINVSLNSAANAKNVKIYLDGGKIYTAIAFHNLDKSTTDKHGGVGALESYELTVTDNFDILNNFSVGFSDDPLKFGGICGTSVFLDGSYCIGSDKLGSYTLNIEDGVYDDVISHVSTGTFDKNGIKRIASGAGLPAGLVPQTLAEMSVPAVYGDVNGDGKFNNSDISSLVRYLSGWIDDGVRSSCSDADGNGRINNRDAVTLIFKLADTQPKPLASFSESEYYIITKDEYLDKTTAAFLGQLAGFLSGHEYEKGSDGKCIVGMPDSKFVYLGGLYAAKAHADKHIYNESTGIWELWFDDDFSVDIVNQYIVADMFYNKNTLSQKYITDGWRKYDVWDMGGGQRQVGAFGLASRHNYLPQYLGNGEYGNWYSYISEPYLGTDTLGMNAAGMPETARELAAMFSQATGDRDNLYWSQMFSAMISMAYFESDIDTIIRESSKVCPEGSWPLKVIDKAYELYAKYPSNWRRAYKELEQTYYTEGITSTADTDINCAFVILDLLYGGGDYMTTCKIGSLAGYDCESTCGIALAILGIIGGTDILPEATNTYIWQNGDGILTNLVAESSKDDSGVWMIAGGLQSRMKISDVIDKYQENFESILKDRGGHADDYFYYIPKETLREYTSVNINNAYFDNGTLAGYTTQGNVSVTNSASVSYYAAKLEDNSKIHQKISGLEVGKTYALSAYIRTTGNATAYLYVSDTNGSNAVCASVHSTVGTPKNEAHSSIKRTLYFTATSTEMIFGVISECGSGEYAVAGAFELVQTQEKSVGTVKITGKTSNNVYAGSLALRINSTTDKEVYLKIRFANENGSITDLPLVINGRKYATAAVYKTNAADNMENADYMYIPIVLSEGENTVSTTFSGSLTIYSAELVEFSQRS